MDVREYRRQQMARHLQAMLDADRALYERMMDTPGFAFHWNQICILGVKTDGDLPVWSG